jgi:cytochrome c553
VPHGGLLLFAWETSMRLGLFLLVTGFGVAMAGVSVLGDEARLKRYGQHLAQECTGCHRIDGIDNGIPSIVGWDADRFIATLGFYQSGARTNPVMVSVAKSLDEEQARALATYYGSLARPARK